jgi:hypothetical protein
MTQNRDKRRKVGQMVCQTQLWRQRNAKIGSYSPYLRLVVQRKPLQGSIYRGGEAAEAHFAVVGGHALICYAWLALTH